MMGAVAGLASREGVEVVGMEAAAVSYPGFRAPTSRGWWLLMLVAIDGPAGAGKSSVARAAAAALGFTYLDTGAMYRCVGLLWAREPTRAAGEIAASVEIALGARVVVDGEDVTDAIRSPRRRRRRRGWRPTRRSAGRWWAPARADPLGGLGRRGP